MESEIGSQVGQSLAARGINNSGMGVGIVEGNKRIFRQYAFQLINEEEAKLQQNVAEMKLKLKMELGD